MKATFLKADVPLTKTFTMEGGEIKKIGHPRVINYHSFDEQFETIEDLHTLLLRHAKQGHCFLKGNVSRPLVNESRAGTTDPNAPTRIMLLDFDGVKGIDDIEDALAQLKLSGTDYIVQYSSSMGVLPERGLSAHVFIILDRDTAPAILKQWLIHQNLTVPTLRQNLALTRTANALRWALDVSTCQNDKLIYIAPPLLKEGVVDGFKGDRIQLVKGKRQQLTLPGGIPNAEANKVASDKALNELRAVEGLPARPRATYKAAGPVEYLSKPDKAVVSGVRTERGFVYLNLNGGDSWGYYHSENNPEFIHNFKGEPVYKTSELLPEYWSQVRQAVNETRVDTNGNVYLAFRDFRTATYYNGIFNSNTKTLDLAVAKSSSQLKDFLMQHGQPVGDFVPDWTVTFNPHSDEIVNLKEQTVNTYQPSLYMRMKPRKILKVPPTIRKVIFHALGNDEEAFERFMNWLSVIMQFRVRTGTTWVLHGTQGTGKGLMLNFILRPLFGMDYVVSKRMEELESQFNGYMEKCFILFVDEVQLSESSKTNILEANLKTFISEPKISIRRMHTLPYEVDSYLNIIFASNMDDPVVIRPEDRRFNVAVYQDKPLEITNAEVQALEDELADFYGYLMNRKADRDLARTPLNNSAKRQMVSVSRTAIDVACEAVMEGNLQFFWDQRPAGSIDSLPAMERKGAELYIQLLDRIVKENPPNILREEIFILLQYTIGGMPTTPYKLTTRLKHHKVHIGPITRDGKPARGIAVKWNINPEWKGKK